MVKGLRDEVWNGSGGRVEGGRWKGIKFNFGERWD